MWKWNTEQKGLLKEGVEGRHNRQNMGLDNTNEL